VHANADMKKYTPIEAMRR